MILPNTIGRPRARCRAIFAVSKFSGVLLLASGVVGCGSGVGSIIPIGDSTLGNRGGSQASALVSTEREPNDTFPQAMVVLFDSTGAASAHGTIAMFGDLDVFLLGALSPGDQITVDVDTTGSALDVSVALFDDRQRLVYSNDDRGGSSHRGLDSYIEWIVRHAGSSYYLVVTNSAFADVRRETGSYRADVQVIEGGPVQGPVGQILLLDFDGAVVDSPALGSFNLGLFDAADIDRVYRGETEMIKETIRSVMERGFERFDVTIVTTDDPPLPDGTKVSTVYFGGLDPGVFGKSEDVDLYNTDFCDDAIIFTQSFDPDLFFTTPTAAEIAVAIGNVASHEAGHLLGLNHVDDDRALMDDRSPPNVLLEDQVFMEAPLSRDVMQIGKQDAVLLLDEIVGPGIDGF